MATKAKKEKEVQQEFYPEYDTVLVKEIVPGERLSSGGIIIPETVENDPDEDVLHGEIIAIGKASNPNRPFQWEVGTVIIFGFYNGRKVQFKGEEYKLIRHLDILGAIK